MSEENDKQFHELVNSYPITYDELFQICQTVCEFVELTRIIDIEPYLFINKDKGIPRLPCMLYDYNFDKQVK